LPVMQNAPLDRPAPPSSSNLLVEARNPHPCGLRACSSTNLKIDPSGPKIASLTLALAIPLRFDRLAGQSLPQIRGGIHTPRLRGRAHARLRPRTNRLEVKVRVFRIAAIFTTNLACAHSEVLQFRRRSLHASNSASFATLGGHR
jgi:hypothetical protein